jgi:stage III sporulation protein AB
VILIKIIGSALIVLSASLMGLYYSNRENFRIADLAEFKKTLILLRSEIEFSMTALPEAMLTLSEKTSKKFAPFYKYIGLRLNEKTGEGIGVIWREALEGALLKTYFAAEDIDYFRSLGDALGVMDRALQQNSLRMMTDYIDAKTDALYEAGIKSKKMYPSLGILGGILIAVVLL